MEELKQNIAKKLIYYRKKCRLTQSEIAEKISYSDKSISKWERGEALPDIAVLKSLAGIYGVTVEHLISPEEKHMKLDSSLIQHLKDKRILVSLLSVCLVWFVATFAFATMRFFIPHVRQAWWCFIIAIPASFIVTTVFSELWANKILRTISASLLNWSATLALFLIFDLHNKWLIFVVAVPLQIMIILWFMLKRKLNLIENKKQSIDNSSGQK